MEKTEDRLDKLKFIAKSIGKPGDEFVALASMIMILDRSMESLEKRLVEHMANPKMKAPVKKRVTKKKPK